MALTNKPKIGIVGVGYLGGAVKYWFDKHNFPSFFYDKHKKIGSIQDLNKAEIIFMCLPTPFVEENNKGFDDSAILEILRQIKGEKIIVVKSTVLPGSTESYQEKFPQHKILINPEFLMAKTAIQDFLNPARQIIGYTRESKDTAKRILDILPKAHFKKIITATEAEMIKYFGNVFLANRVIFSNQIYDLCQKIRINYEIVKECAAADPRIGSSHLNIFHDGYRGYGGPCIPKDVKSFIQFTEKIGVESRLFKALEKINKELIKRNQDE